MSLSGWRPADVVGWIEQEARTGVGTALDHKQRRSHGSPSTPKPPLGARYRRGVQFVEEVGPENPVVSTVTSSDVWSAPRVLSFLRHPLLSLAAVAISGPLRPCAGRRMCHVDRTALRSSLGPPPPDPIVETP